MKLKHKVVVVTGGSTGLGEAICYEAAKQGAIVIVCARRKEQIEKVSQKCQQLSGQPSFAFLVDVSVPESIEDLVVKINQAVDNVDILVNNAGFGVFEEFLSFDLEQARQMFEVNFFGMLYLTQALAIGMVEKKQGHIINIASMAGKMATPKSTVYSATKFAVLGFSNALRLELKPHHVQVTTVNPGPIKTTFFDQADPSGEYLDKIDWFVLDPQKLAKLIVNNMIRPKREINRPYAMSFAARCYDLFPTIGDYLAGGIFNKK
ncbi:SDR family NAD(P)-dependent oxidoreductase [Enterococcus lemanii]|uniref:SDR family NAD(P)-dependent oxidoreductase n=1 Tax=Enterococcus lemanii TaxID=1159752 RepID=A0ABV9MWQ8_9ENTE|nr:SDR family oxidoreductase [Enterococcus lemanii]MBM7709201.1 short-subunit dehydrogenase [Enterococcus lemanii]